VIGHLPLSPDEIDAILKRGERAKSLLTNEDFLAIVDDLSNYHLAALVACAPGERDRETREFHHTMHAALREIAQEIQQRVSAAEEIKARLDQLNEDDE
jgi:hypothetical protein